MVMPFDTYGASARARALADEVERRRRLQSDLGNPQTNSIREVVDTSGVAPLICLATQITL